MRCCNTVICKSIEPPKNTAKLNDQFSSLLVVAFFYIYFLLQVFVLDMYRLV